MRYPITFENEGQHLIGVVHRPDADRAERQSGRPGVVMFHGFGGQKVEAHRSFVKMAERLAANGIVTLRFDFRCSGDSEGNFEEMTFGGEVSDALRALTYIVDEEQVDPERLGVIGLSMGGAVAACVTGRFKRLRATALWSAVADMDLFRAVAAEVYRELGDVEVWDRGGNLVGRAFIDGLEGFSPYQEVAQADTPVLIVHGDNDQTVPVSHAHQFASSLAKAGVEHKLHIIPGADHTYNKHEWETEVLDVTTDWLVKHL